MNVYVLTYHDPWDVRPRGPVDTSVQGVYASRNLAEHFLFATRNDEFPCPLVEEWPEDLDAFIDEDGNKGFYMLTEETLR